MHMLHRDGSTLSMAASVWTMRGTSIVHVLYEDVCDLLFHAGAADAIHVETFFNRSDVVLGGGESTALYCLDVGRYGFLDAGGTGHEVANKARLFAGVDAKHIVEH